MIVFVQIYNCKTMLTFQSVCILNLKNIYFKIVYQLFSNSAVGS